MITCRAALEADMPAIAALFEQENGRAPSTDYINACLSHYPATVASDENGLVGFLYCNRFAPDILEIANFLVREECRGAGVGRQLLVELENLARGDWASLILVNSGLYPHPPRPSPRGFYEKQGFAVIHETAATQVFVKAL